MSGNISVRISGEAIFDVPYNIAKDIYINNPVLPRLYKTYKDLVLRHRYLNTMRIYMCGKNQIIKKAK